MNQFIVAEVSKNWGGEGQPVRPLVSQLFEDVIEVNRQRGYRLHSFQLHRLMTADDVMNESIIAVFEKTGGSDEGNSC